MTITKLLQSSGLNYKPWDAPNLGKVILRVAKEKKIKWGKTEEIINVNDYPDSFIEDMQEALIKYFSDKPKK